MVRPATPGIPSNDPSPVSAAEQALTSLLPEAARRYQGRRAGVVSRLLANTIDFILVVAILLVSYLGLCGALFLWHTNRFHFPSFSRSEIFIAGAVVLVLYLTATWAIVGRTYGDHLLGLAVIDRRGRRPHLLLAFVRAVFCGVFPIGVLWVAVSQSNRSVQDIVLRTSVMYEWA